MLDMFNDDVLRVANLLAYEQSTAQIPPMLVAAAQLYLSWVDEMPEPVIRTAPETASGEIIAR